jgi:TM2 domain-containing membrane protein YozV
MLRGIFAIIFLIPALSVLASPERDFDKFVNHFKERFPNPA